MIFDPNGAALGRNQRAGIEGALYVSCSRALLAISNVTVPLSIVNLMERSGMVFFTPLKGIIFCGPCFYLLLV